MPDTGIDAEYRARVEGWVAAGTGVFTSADKLYAFLRDTEFSAPRRIVRDVWRETIVADSYVPLINRLDPDSLIPRSWVKPTDWNYTEPYAVKVKVTGQMGPGEELSDHFVTLLYSDMPTTGQVGEDYGGALEWSNINYVPGTLSYHIEQVAHQRYQPW